MRTLHRFFSLALSIIALLANASNANAGTSPFTQEAKRPPDGGIFKWNGREWTQVPGAGFRISVGPDGSPWMVQYQGDIYRWVNGGFERVPGQARDIGVGANGAVWIIGWDNGIYKWNGHEWDRMPGMAVTISVQSNGTPWVVNAAGEIYHWVTDHFDLLPGRARDVGAEKSIWIIDQDGLLYKWMHGDWLRDAGAGIAIAGNAKRITVGPDGSPWVVNAAREIYRWTDGAFQKFPGAATDVGVGADASVWIVGPPETAPKPGKLGGKLGAIIGAIIEGGQVKKDGGSDKAEPGPIGELPPRSDAGPIVGLPPRSDAGPIAGRSSENRIQQGFRYAPSVIPATDSVTFKFVTTQSTIPTIEISNEPPEPGPRFNQDAVVSSASPAEAGKQTRHNVRLGNLKPRTRYYYIITITDERGRVVTEGGEFITSIRIDK